MHSSPLNRVCLPSVNIASNYPLAQNFVPHLHIPSWSCSLDPFDLAIGAIPTANSSTTLDLPLPPLCCNGLPGAPRNGMICWMECYEMRRYKVIWCEMRRDEMTRDATQKTCCSLMFTSLLPYSMLPVGSVNSNLRMPSSWCKEFVHEWNDIMDSVRLCAMWLFSYDRIFMMHEIVENSMSQGCMMIQW